MIKSALKTAVTGWPEPRGRGAEAEAVGLEYARSGERNHDFRSNALSCGIHE